MRAIALGQRRIIYCLLSEVVFFAYFIAAGMVIGVVFEGGPMTDLAIQTAVLPGQLGYAIVKIIQLILTWKLCRALGTHGIVSLGTLVGCLGMVVLLWISGQATHRLRRAGVRVGLLGASMRDLPGPVPLL